MAQGKRINDHLEVLVDNTPMIAAAIKRLANTDVMVGIPSDQEQPHYDESGGQAKGTEKRTDTPSGIGNANIGYIHETGAGHVPARPWLSPGIRLNQRKWTDYMKQAGKLAFTGNVVAADKAWNAAGITAVSGVKARIQSDIPPPLSPRTVAGRVARRGDAVGSATASDFTALIDTAQFINSVSYVVRQKGKGGGTS
jgi:hypothetical protein